MERDRKREKTEGEIKCEKGFSKRCDLVKTLSVKESVEAFSNDRNVFLFYWGMEDVSLFHTHTHTQTHIHTYTHTHIHTYTHTHIHTYTHTHIHTYTHTIVN